MDIARPKEWRLSGPFGFTRTVVSLWLTRRGIAVCLRENEVLSVRDGRGWTVKVVAGRVWITQEGEISDIFLDKGESFTVACNGVTAIGPIGEATVFVSANAGRVAQVRAHVSQLRFGSAPVRAALRAIRAMLPRFRRNPVRAGFAAIENGLAVRPCGEVPGNSKS